MLRKIAAGCGVVGRVRTVLFLLVAPLMMVGALALAPTSVWAGDPEDERDGPELPDSARVQFRGDGGPTFYPERLILVGPRSAMVAGLPRRADLFEENRLPVGKLGRVGRAFEEPPLLDRIGAGSRLGALYRADDALIVIFETEGAYRDALWRLRQPVGLVTRLSRGRGLASMRLALDFRPLSRARAPVGGAREPIGVAHGAGPMLILTPPRRSLPRNNIF